MSLDTFLRHRVTIMRSQEVQSITGAAVRVWLIIGTAVPFDIQQFSGRQVLTDAGRLLDVDAVGYCHATVDVLDPYAANSTATDRIFDGAKTFDVLRVDTVRTHHKKLLLALAPAE